MNKSEVTNLLERAKAVTQESPDEWTFEQWEPLARKHGFITFSGRNGFMDGYLVSYKKSKKITEAITRLAESYLAAIKTLEWIADPRKRDHKEPDKYTECACMMNKADEFLRKVGEY